MAGGDISSFCEIVYSNGDFDQLLKENEKDIYIESPRAKPNAKSVKMLYFKKVSN